MKWVRGIMHNGKTLLVPLAILLLLAIAPPAIANPDVIWLVSVSSASALGNGDSWFPSLSANGRFVTFYSQAANLVAGDNNGFTDAFVRDRQTGATTRVSVSSNGTQANDFSAAYRIDISSDGNFVAFESNASNLVAGDTNEVADVFVHDRQTGATTGGNNGATFPTISSDGRFVAFQSGATNLVTGDTNNVQDIFVWDRQIGTTTRVSVSSTGAQANFPSDNPSLSANSRFVAFQSPASTLITGDTNGLDDVFVHDRQTGTTTRVSVSSTGAQGDGHSSRPAMSADGRFVAFESMATNLVAGDNNGFFDIFVHDRLTATTTRVNLSSAGAQGSGGASIFPHISGDGRFVAFQSTATNLVAGDTNNTTDVFVHDRQTGNTVRVSVSEAGAEGNMASDRPSISLNGGFIAFRSWANTLVAGDNNGMSDIFVAQNPLFTVPSLNGLWLSHNTPTTIKPGEIVPVSVTVVNTGTQTWPKTGANPVYLSYHWLNSANQVSIWDGLRTTLPDDVVSGQTVTLTASLRAPQNQLPETFTLYWDMVREGVAWFSAQGVPTLNVPGINVATTKDRDVQWVYHNTPATIKPGQIVGVPINITNIGNLIWPVGGGFSSVYLAYHWFNTSNEVVVWDGLRTTVPYTPTGTMDILTGSLMAPSTPGTYKLIWDMVQENVAWFSGQSAPAPVLVPPNLSVAATQQRDVQWVSHNTPTSLAANQQVSVNITLTNTGSQSWPQGGANPVKISYHWLNPATGAAVVWDGQMTTLSGDVAIGQMVTLSASLQAPSTTGSYTLAWDMVQVGMAWFSGQGAPLLAVSPITVN